MKDIFEQIVANMLNYNSFLLMHSADEKQREISLKVESLIDFIRSEPSPFEVLKSIFLFKSEFEISFEHKPLIDGLDMLEGNVKNNMSFDDLDYLIKNKDQIIPENCLLNNKDSLKKRLEENIIPNAVLAKVEDLESYTRSEDPSQHLVFTKYELESLLSKEHLLLEILICQSNLFLSTYEGQLNKLSKFLCAMPDKETTIPFLKKLLHRQSFNKFMNNSTKYFSTKDKNSIIERILGDNSLLDVINYKQSDFTSVELGLYFGHYQDIIKLIPEYNSLPRITFIENLIEEKSEKKLVAFLNKLFLENKIGKLDKKDLYQIYKLAIKFNKQIFSQTLFKSAGNALKDIKLIDMAASKLALTKDREIIKLPNELQKEFFPYLHFWLSNRSYSKDELSTKDIQNMREEVMHLDFLQTN